jgi:hypothetical protein
MVGGNGIVRPVQADRVNIQRWQSMARSASWPGMAEAGCTAFNKGAFTRLPWPV